MLGGFADIACDFHDRAAYYADNDDYSSLDGSLYNHRYSQRSQLRGSGWSAYPCDSGSDDQRQWHLYSYIELDGIRWQYNMVNYKPYLWHR